MASGKGEPVGSKKTEIIIAIIGLVGILATAVFSNWDKLFHQGGVVTARYSGYQPTNNFETEIRYFMEVSGTRAQIADMQDQLLNSMRDQLMSSDPDSAAEITRLTNIAREEAASFDSVLEIMLPVWRQHYTLDEIQELNRFYSTEPMQAMVRKSPLIMRELAPRMAEFIRAQQERMMTRFMEEDMPGDEPAADSPASPETRQ